MKTKDHTTIIFRKSSVMNYEGTVRTLLDGQTMVDRTPKAKFDLPAFLERGPSFTSQLSLRGLKSCAEGTSKMADVKVGYSA